MPSASSTRQPNILLIMTDQQRWDTIAALGNPIIKTPALDSLVRSGVTFTNAYTPSPVCVSARCALTSGLPPHLTGCIDNTPMPQNVPSMMDHLAAAGYQTHGVGKMHFTPELHRMWGFESRDFSEKGAGGEGDFRQFLDENGYAYVDEPNGMRSEMYYIPQPSQLPAHLHHTAWVGERSSDFLKHRDRERPFFLWSSFVKPHPPFEVPTPWNKLYRAAEMAAPFRPEGYDDLLTYWNRVQNRYKYRDQGFDDLLLRTMAAMYYGCISFIDYHVGRVLDTLGDDADNTLILFTSDHGDLLGDYGSFGKRCMLDASARVPLLARWPGVLESGQQCAEPATLLDLFPDLSGCGW
ncbi:MAG: sulfatase-like hydrolase/transferase, partial [Caldilineaceae bacterium]|nr:sulfatase-like hydrolase/transferase [Caldilineaceae bacterium]